MIGPASLALAAGCGSSGSGGFTGEVGLASRTRAPSWAPTTPGTSPDGGCIPPLTVGPANGLSSLQAPGDALVGVFLDATVPSGQAPTGFDFSGGTAFASLSPLLRQPFFIGDGLTGTGSGAVQHFVVPAGATRLFLASRDSVGGNQNNTGQFAVTISVM